MDEIACLCSKPPLEIIDFYPISQGHMKCSSGKQSIEPFMEWKAGPSHPVLKVWIQVPSPGARNQWGESLHPPDHKTSHLPLTNYYQHQELQSQSKSPSLQLQVTLHILTLKLQILELQTIGSLKPIPSSNPLVHDHIVPNDVPRQPHYYQIYYTLVNLLILIMTEQMAPGIQ